MPIPEPTFDTRTYRELLTEALARIPVHNPEWTNFNDADPGVTLLQLFAFLSESVIYRANRIPARNRLKFLNLLGIPLRPATAAEGLVEFRNPRGPLAAVTLPAERTLYAGPVPFRTRNGLQVLPIEARAYYKEALTETTLQAEAQELYRRLYASFETSEQSLAFYTPRTFTAPTAGAVLPVLDLGTTIDGALWLALLARPREDVDAARRAIAHQVLTLGILPGLETAGSRLAPGTETTTTGAGLLFEMPNIATLDARYRPLEARTDTDLLAAPGVVELILPAAGELGYWNDLDPLEAGSGNYPPSLEETEDAERLLTWIRIRPAAATETTGGQLQARISWIGVNAAQVVQKAWVPAERLPDGTGEPGQSATLTQKPVLPDSVQLSVNGERWQRIDDLNAAPPEIPPRSPRLTSPPADAGTSKVYTVDRDSGEIRFGDGVHGTRPPRGAVIQVAYAYGGGSEGVVGIGAINRGPELPIEIRVANPVPTWGGERAETVAEAEQRVPTFLYHRDRLLSAADFRAITWETPGVELGRVDVLPLFHPEQPQQRSAGVVTVLVIPRTDPVQPETPAPDRLFLELICRWLAPRRLITTELHIRGPVYIDVWVSVGIEVAPGRDQGPVRTAVAAAVKAFLSPLTGGFDAGGWPLNRPVEAAELAAAASRVDGVAKLTGLLLGDPAGIQRERVELAGLQLPRLRAVGVTVGDPQSLEALRGESLAPEPQIGPDAARLVPVPVVPEAC